MKPQVRMVTIDDNSATQRLDNFLIRELKGAPKSLIYRIVRRGEVRVNMGRRKVHYRLVVGDIVRIPPIRLTAPSAARAPSSMGEQLERAILFEDERILVLNKPSGMAVHGGSGIQFGVIEGLRQRAADGDFLELVHRLDRDTSGCLMLAKKRSALRAMHQQFRDDQVEKRYLALLTGAWQRKKQVVDIALRKNVLKSGERMVIVARDGKPALTIFRRQRAFSDATLVEAELKTGRTHQIRVHAKWLGHPLAGDQRYGHDEVNRALRQRGLKRLFLHAAKLAFTDPHSEHRITVNAPLDPALERFLEQLT